MFIELILRWVMGLVGLSLKFKDVMFSIVPLAKAEYRVLTRGRPVLDFALKSLAIILIVAFFIYLNGIRPPRAFPEGAVISVPHGHMLAAVAEKLESEQVIPSAPFFELLMRALSLDNRIIAGEYVFAEPVSAFGIARSLVRGEFGLKPIRVTIPEGATSYDIAAILEQKLGTDPAVFLTVAEKSEGYLFPDTYFFLPNARPETIVRVMHDTFFDKIQSQEERLAASEHSLHEIITMASLLEKEAFTLDQRKEIAAVLWRRLEINMPLQVDAVFGYIYKRPTFHPRYSHLEVDSPYNTYKYKGLPPGPIANPGLASIQAALSPADNEYLYYLSDKEGNLHFSREFEEHVRKKGLYIN